MRQLKFRGERADNGEWIYGSLINNAFVNAKDRSPCMYMLPDLFDDGQYIDSWEDIANYMDDYEIVPESVGQFTGLKDKNGVEIYESDVVYLAGYGNYTCVFPFIQLYESQAESDIGSIIGNVYENPELLNH